MPHSIHRRPVGVDLVAKPAEEGRRDGGALGHTGNLEAQNALDEEVGGDTY